ncbi:hypothetical protein ACFQ0Q_48010 [Streptomyces aureus]
MPLRAGARRGPWAGGTSSLKPAYDGGASIGTLAERTGLIDPICTALAAWWATAGRVVPGQADQEWNMLVSRCPWPTR